eukprot:355267-Chlamydomonas_euryale.AAC.1
MPGACVLVLGTGSTSSLTTRTLRHYPAKQLTIATNGRRALEEWEGLPLSLRSCGPAYAAAPLPSCKPLVCQNVVHRCGVASRRRGPQAVPTQKCPMRQVRQQKAWPSATEIATATATTAATATAIAPPLLHIQPPSTTARPNTVTTATAAASIPRPARRCRRVDAR